MRMLTDLTRRAMTEFEEKLRQQHEDSMHRELEALLTTTNKAEAEVGTPMALLLPPNIPTNALKL